MFLSIKLAKIKTFENIILVKTKKSLKLLVGVQTETTLY